MRRITSFVVLLQRIFQHHMPSPSTITNRNQTLKIQLRRLKLRFKRTIIADMTRGVRLGKRVYVVEFIADIISGMFKRLKKNEKCIHLHAPEPEWRPDLAYLRCVGPLAHAWSAKFTVLSTINHFCRRITGQS